MDPSTLEWIGLGMTGFFALFMLVASVAPKLVGADVARGSMVKLGWDPRYTLMIGLIELGCTLLYLFPATSVLGAVLMMGLLGGAMATHLRSGSPLFSHTLFSIYLGLLMWGGLWLRDPSLAALFPLRLA